MNRDELLKQLEARDYRLGVLVGDLSKERTALRPLMTSLRMGEDPGVVVAQLHAAGYEVDRG